MKKLFSVFLAAVLLTLTLAVFANAVEIYEKRIYINMRRRSPK